MVPCPQKVASPPMSASLKVFLPEAYYCTVSSLVFLSLCSLIAFCFRRPGLYASIPLCVTVPALLSHRCTESSIYFFPLYYRCTLRSLHWHGWARRGAAMGAFRGNNKIPLAEREKRRTQALLLCQLLLPIHWGRSRRQRLGRQTIKTFRNLGYGRISHGQRERAKVNAAR